MWICIKTTFLFYLLLLVLEYEWNAEPSDRKSNICKIGKFTCALQFFYYIFKREKEVFGYCVVEDFL